MSAQALSYNSENFKCCDEILKVTKENVLVNQIGDGHCIKNTGL